MKARNPRRQVARTVLLVGEGDSEVQWLHHIKALYVTRGCGVAVTIKNAHGKGASHVVDMAIRQSSNAAFDAKAALLDTDTDWNDATRSRARRADVVVITAHPCLEGLLLSMHGHAVEGRNSAQLKRDFRSRFGAAASEMPVYDKHFSKELLERCRQRLPDIARLLDLVTRSSN